jgi:hypothetical protein
MAESNKTCAHPPCSCPVSSGEKYCGPYCESAKDRSEVSCPCEHPSCSGKAL